MSVRPKRLVRDYKTESFGSPFSCSSEPPNPGAAPHPPAANVIEDEVTDAIERSYASRFTTGTDLSPDELKRIKEKQATGTDAEA